jgi:UDP-glucuronate 4-epimerase
MTTILVTGSAGFIGFHTSLKLLSMGHQVVGIDNFNEYYDPKLKEARSKILSEFPNFKLHRGNIEDLEFVEEIFQIEKIDQVCHLAAQAGVRYSLTNPHAYITTNIVGFNNVIKATQQAGIKTFVYASSSSVYGNNQKIPFAESDPVDEPVSLYAATKKSNELIAYSYHHLYGLQCTGLRFFTVYGPWGRPDMAYFSFTRDIKEGKPIKVFNHGRMKRDFTYVDDIVDGIVASLARSYPFEIFNLGNNQPVELGYFVKLIEKELNKTAQIEYLPMQPGDVQITYANIDKATELLGYHPETSIEGGISQFVAWFEEYYQ